MRAERTAQIVSRTPTAPQVGPTHPREAQPCSTIGGAPGNGHIRLRKVFYISGFDPMGPRRYRELYRREAARSAHPIRVSAHLGQRDREFGWTVHWNGDGGVTSSVECLRWDDLSRVVARPSLWRIYAETLLIMRRYLRSGAFQAMWALHRGPRIAALGALALVFFYVVYAGLAAAAAFVLAQQAAGLPVILAAALGALAFCGTMLATRVIEQQVLVCFLLADLAHMSARDGAYPRPLDQRIDAFAARLSQAVTDPRWDEVLLVGHSSGAQVAISTAARALANSRSNAKLSLLTLGQTIPMSSFLPAAGRLRAELAQVADDARVFWVDVTAPSDGACFALCDPAAVTRANGRGHGGPLVVSASAGRGRDTTTRGAERWRFLRQHFQYLLHVPKPGAFDWFAITAGPVSLTQRFRYRRPSPSLVATPVAPVLFDG